MDNEIEIGFMNTFDNAAKFFQHALSQKYIVKTSSPENGYEFMPQFLLIGDANFGTDHQRIASDHLTTKIFYTGENVRPDYFTYDHAITFDHENSSKHYRLPLYVLEMWAITQDSPQITTDYLYLVNDKTKIDFEREVAAKNAPCAYIQSNPHCRPRTELAEYLIREKFLNSGGPHLNTLGRVIPRDRALKIDFFKQHYFGIAFENGSYPGYVTEKLLDCYYSNTVPIYWGSSTVHRDFNPKSFVNASDFKNHVELHKYLLHLLSHRTEYMDILTAPAFYDNIPNEYTNLTSFTNWFHQWVWKTQ